MRNIFKCVTAIAAIGFASVIGAQLSSTGNGQAWAGPHDSSQHTSVIRISEGEYFPQTRKVRIGGGKSVLIELPREVRDVVVSNPEIVDAVVQTSTRSYLIAKKFGQSNAFFFDADGEQLLTLEIVVERDVSVLSDMLNRLIPHAKITAEILNDTVILTGKVRNPSDANRAADIAARFVVVEGGASNKRNHEKVVNLLVVEANEQVLLKVTIAEMERTTIKRIGVNWNSINIGDSGLQFATQNAFPTTSGVGANNILTGVTGPSNSRNSCFSGGGDHIPGTFGGNVLPRGFPGSFSADGSTLGGVPAGGPSFSANCLAKTIEAFERNGLIRTLAEPTLTAISGETASFLAGGEFPIPVADDDGKIAVDWKPFGVGLSFTPVVMSEGRVSMRISTEVSELSNDGAVSVGSINIQGLKVRRANTTVELPSGGSLVLAGLISDDTRQNLDGLPGLKKLPILGSLFRSRDFRKKETELVIMVTPYMVKPVARQKLTRPDKGFVPASDQKSVFMGQLNQVYGRREEMPAGGYKGNVGFIID